MNDNKEKNKLESVIHYYVNSKLFTDVWDEHKLIRLEQKHIIEPEKYQLFDLFKLVLYPIDKIPSHIEEKISIVEKRYSDYFNEKIELINNISSLFTIVPNRSNIGSLLRDKHNLWSPQAFHVAITNHVDVFDLIPQGFAFSVYDLSFDPYSNEQLTQCPIY